MVSGRARLKPRAVRSSCRTSVLQRQGWLSRLSSTWSQPTLYVQRRRPGMWGSRAQCVRRGLAVTWSRTDQGASLGAAAGKSAVVEESQHQNLKGERLTPCPPAARAPPPPGPTPEAAPGPHLHALAVGGAARVDVAPGGVGPHERDGRDVGVVQDCIHGGVGAVNHVQHALGQAWGGRVGDGAGVCLCRRARMCGRVAVRVCVSGHGSRHILLLILRQPQ